MEELNVVLSQDEALVLLEFLHRNDGRDSLGIEDAAESAALWSVEAQLEKQLVQPFKENYRELVALARSRIRGRAE